MFFPSADAPFGTWDADLPDDRGATVPLLRWAATNDYSVAIFSAAALKANAAKASCRYRDNISNTPKPSIDKQGHIL